MPDMLWGRTRSWMIICVVVFFQAHPENKGNEAETFPPGEVNASCKVMELFGEPQQAS